MKNLWLAGLMLSLAMLVACDKGGDEAKVETVDATETADTGGNAIDDATEEDYNIKTPADLPVALQDKMIRTLADYNACMKKPRPEFFTDDAEPEKVAGEVMEKCEVHLASVQTMLDENGVLKSFTVGVLKKRRNKASRKLMGNVMNAKVAREVQRAQEGEH